MNDMVTIKQLQQLAKILNPPIDDDGAWVIEAQWHAINNPTIISNAEALRIAFELECG
jgi:hypothetical protein